MKKNLSEYFLGIGVKRLSEVETSPEVSNQHEFNGIRELKDLLGTERRKLNGVFTYFGDNEDECFSDKSILTWYDSRENHPTRSEFRLYYSSNEVMNYAKAGDIVIMGLPVQEAENIYVFVVKDGYSGAC